MEYMPFLETLIAYENKVIQSYRKMALSLLAISLLLIILVALIELFPAHGDQARLMYGLLEIGGGLFISSLAVFPVKEIINHKDKIVLLEMLEELIQSVGNQSELGQDIRDFITQSLEKIAIGGH
jgi:hypothetical protein